MTTTPARPALGGQHTRKTEDRRTAALETGISITLGGETFTVRKGDISPAIARRFRREVGCSTNALFDEFGEDPDVDTFAAFVWLARLCAGDEITLDAVPVDYGLLDDDGFDVKIVDGEGNEVDPSPEG